LIDKYPQSKYITHAQSRVKGYEQNKALEKFQANLKAYSTPPPDAAKLDQLFAAGEDYLKVGSARHYVVAYMALAGANGAITQVYKDLGKVKGYADTALKLFESASPAEGWNPQEWAAMRDLVQAQMNQYLGWMLINQYPDAAQAPKAEQEQAIVYLARATQIKGKDGAGWKDPNNYYQRTTIYSNQYTELKKKYDALPDEQKNAEAGKELLKQINELLDTKLIPDYARVLATATKPETKNFYDAVKPEFDNFWKYRTGVPDKAEAYVKNYVSDPTISPVTVPAKADDSGGTTELVNGPSNAKLAPGSSAGAPGSKSTSNGGRGKQTKGKATKGGSKRKGKS
jgi:hypothetical protein